jgi:hypothetical protein
VNELLLLLNSRKTTTSSRKKAEKNLFAIYKFRNLGKLKSFTMYKNFCYVIVEAHQVPVAFYNTAAACVCEQNVRRLKLAAGHGYGTSNEIQRNRLLFRR